LATVAPVSVDEAQLAAAKIDNAAAIAEQTDEILNTALTPSC
jgi:hypothetical protein